VFTLTPLLLGGQLLLIALACLASPSLPAASAGRLRPCLRWFRAVARRRTLASALVGLVALGSCLAFAAVKGWPIPRVHDEFSYLLAADTFAHGRLANPTHPLWEHFESMHILQCPAYVSKYPPAQGLFLAAGQVLFGHPAVGVWLSLALACAGLCWMLQAWVPARWALLGGLLAALHPSIVNLWGHTYWGGATAFLGGALVYGALRRLWRQPRPLHALLFALGLALLANSRPYEGLVVSLPAAAAVCYGLCRRWPWSVSVPALVFPLVLGLGVAAAAMGAYNAAITGNVLRMPYQVYEETYQVAPFFLFLAPRPMPDYHHKVIQDFFCGWALAPYAGPHTLLDRVREAGLKCLDLWQFYLQPVLTVPLLTLPLVLRNRWSRLAAVACALVTAAVLPITWLNPTYAAPFAGLLFLLVVQGMRWLALWRSGGRPAGRWLVGSLVAIEALALVFVMVQKTPADDPGDWSQQRARLCAELRQQEGKHLVVVRYGPGHDALQEWVYNAADLDAAPVLWAREMSPEQDRRLFAYFRDRKVWLLEADRTPPRLTPYPLSEMADADTP
jgi:hypothetical protein